MRRQRKPDPELIDEGNSEWTEEDFARAKPASEVLPKIFGKEIQRFRGKLTWRGDQEAMRKDVEPKKRLTREAKNERRQEHRLQPARRLAASARGPRSCSMTSKWHGQLCPFCGEGVLADTVKTAQDRYKGQILAATVRGAFCVHCHDGFPEFDAQQEAAWLAFRNRVDAEGTP